jgi:hypothetical protein
MYCHVYDGTGRLAGYFPLHLNHHLAVLFFSHPSIRSLGFAITFVGLFVAYRSWCAQQERLRTAGMFPAAVEITTGGAQGGSVEVATVVHSGFEQDRDQAASAKSAASIYPQGGATETELVVVTPTLHEQEGGAEVV